MKRLRLSVSLLKVWVMEFKYIADGYRKFVYLIKNNLILINDTKLNAAGCYAVSLTRQ
jgi:hypothetical protein